MEMRFIHLTDLHLTAGDRPLYGARPGRRLQAAIAHINEHYAQAECVVLTGDLVHQGHAAGYEALAELLADLALPWHLLPGNHDDRANLRAAFPGVPGEADEFIQYAVETPAGTFLMLDSLIDGSHLGGLCAERLDWLSRTLADQAGRPIYLFLHHPPFRLEQLEDFAGVLEGHDIRHMFFGHIHRPMHGTWRGIGFSCQRSTNHQLHMVGTPRKGPLVGCHEAPAYGLVTVRDGMVIVHDQHFLDDSPRFPLRSRRAREAADLDELAIAVAEKASDKGAV